MNPDIRKAFKTVDYLRMQVEFLPSDQDKEFMNELQATGVVLEPEVMKPEEFQAG